MSARGQAASAGASDAERLQRTFSTFIKLEDAARRAESLDAWRFVVVNETKRLFGYRQAVLATVADRGRPRIDAVSGVAVVERNAPFIRWLERVMATLARGDDAASPTSSAATRFEMLIAPTGTIGARPMSCGCRSRIATASWRAFCG